MGTTPDAVEVAVERVLAAVASGNEAEIAAGYEGLASFQLLEVLAELTLVFEDVLHGVDQQQLIEAAQFPPQFNAPQVISAVLSNEGGALQQATGSDRIETVLALLMVIASGLRTAREGFG